MTIDKFTGRNSFLSNFALCNIRDGDDNSIYPSVEHAFQAAKTTIYSEKESIRNAPTPGVAKRLGRQCTLRKDWETIKDMVMFYLLMKKFQQEPFRSKLIATGNSKLVEGNIWGDTYWGVCRGKGQNKLGKALMKVRSIIMDKTNLYSKGE